MTADSDLYGISGEQCGNDEKFGEEEIKQGLSVFSLANSMFGHTDTEPPEIGDTVVIDNDFGAKNGGGKKTKVLDKKAAVNCEGGYLILTDVYPHYISINWVKKV